MKSGATTKEAFANGTVREKVIFHLDSLMAAKTKELGLENTQFGFSRQMLHEKTGLSMTTIRSLLDPEADYQQLAPRTIGKLMHFFKCESSAVYTIELVEEE